VKVNSDVQGVSVPFLRVKARWGPFVLEVDRTIRFTRLGGC